MAAQYASMEEAEADAKEYIETTVKKAFDHLQPIEDTNEPYKAGDLVLCVQEGVWYPSSLVEQSSRSRNRIHVPSSRCTSTAGRRAGTSGLNPTPDG